MQVNDIRQYINLNLNQNQDQGQCQGHKQDQ